MKKSIIVIIFILIVFKLDCFATRQTGDLLIINKDTLIIYQYPLDKYFSKGNLYNPNFFNDYSRTSCWRGYKAVWIIKENRLYLKDIYDCTLSNKIPIDRIGKSTNDQGLIFAEWFDGSLKINMRTKEEIIEPWNIGRLFMRKANIRIDKGQVIKQGKIN
jgi:hypothetical protein